MNSYVMEASRGLDNHNLVSVLMHHHQTDLNGALQDTQTLCDAHVSRFLSSVNALPSFGTANDERLKFYSDGIAQWARGEDCWSFECRRYFENGKVSQVDRMVEFVPRSHGYVIPARSSVEH